jgi:hypothetical protein
MALPLTAGCSVGCMGPAVRAGIEPWWKLSRATVLSAARDASPLVPRPHDMRHAVASLWLNAGVPATAAARRLGQSVAVLLRVYANCIDGSDEGITTALEGHLADLGNAGARLLYLRGPQLPRQVEATGSNIH